MKRVLILAGALLWSFCTMITAFVPQQVSCLSDGSEKISLKDVSIPHNISQQSNALLQLHYLFNRFVDTWGQVKERDYYYFCEQLRNLTYEGGHAVRDEALVLLVNFFLYHRPFNIERISSFINVVLVSVPLLYRTLHQKLYDAYIPQEQWEVLKPYKQLVVYVVSHHPDASKGLTDECIHDITDDDVIEKLVMGCNLVRMHAARDEIFSYWPIIHHGGYDVLLDCIAMTICKPGQTSLRALIHALSMDPFTIEKVFFHDDVAYVEHLVSHDADWHAVLYRWGYRPMYVAALVGAVGIFKNLVCNGGVIDLQAYYYAIRGNVIEIVQHADRLFHPHYEIRFLFAEAIRWNRTTLADYFLPQMPLDYHDISFAIRAHNIPYLLWFIRNTHNFVSSFSGMQALHAAASGDGLWLAHLLLEMGVNVNSCLSTTRETPLYAAIHRLHAPMVMLLLQFGASVQQAFMGGEWPLHRLMSKLSALDDEFKGYQQDIFRDYFFKENSIHVIAPQTCERFMRTYVDELAIPLIKLLVRVGVSYKKPDMYGRTPMQYALSMDAQYAINLFQAGVHRIE